jgi:hypothetical protein
MSGISKRLRGRGKKQWRKQAFDQQATGFTSGAMGHFDLRFAETDLRLSCDLGGV